MKKAQIIVIYALLKERFIQKDFKVLCFTINHISLNILLSNVVEGKFLKNLKNHLSPNQSNKSNSDLGTGSMQFYKKNKVAYLPSNLR